MITELPFIYQIIKDILLFGAFVWMVLSHRTRVTRDSLDELGKSLRKELTALTGRIAKLESEHKTTLKIEDLRESEGKRNELLKNLHGDVQKVTGSLEQLGNRVEIMDQHLRHRQ